MERLASSVRLHNDRARSASALEKRFEPIGALTGPSTVARRP
jgi:hypothetical protein